MKDDIVDIIAEALAIEIGSFSKVTDLDTFSNQVEGYKPKGDVFYNEHNIIFTDKKDFEHCSYYNKKGIVFELSLPTYKIELFVVSHTDSEILKRAINYKYVESL